ncbi:ABC transporter ATP-binding protein [Aphanothece sacrum]|uniref:ABC transporter n=1 Tax=Aphanothece sacrum FPU1 TaxID=1920663 RepID=A0A401ICJ8_APHSA|nr:ATP-binding cassette domain-containing protein [Aphanothece sacrum]GBF78964.1 ABC transporter [Aphanothece sacrum FPU1]GBF86688.1 ABC transporter [Aphanothece sacrum FPU3]
MKEQNTPLLRLSDVSLSDSLGKISLLEEISFSLNLGDRLGIMGQSGAGKTTLLRLINRLQDPSSGLIEFDGQFLINIPSIKLRQQVVLVPQEPKLLGMTVEETLTYPLLLQKLPQTEIEQRLEQWRSHLSIPDNWLTRNELQLSLGQRQIVSMARGLIMQPKLLLLDEPTSALDSDRAYQLIEKLISLSQNNLTTIIMVNHQKIMVDQFTDRILTLRQGKIIN